MRFTYAELFENACPQYIAMGMTYEQYWDGDPGIAAAYRKAYRLRREIANEEAWLQGLYNYGAFSVTLANAFRPKGAKRQNYFEKPIRIFPMTEAEKRRVEREEFAKMDAAMRSMVRKQKKSRDKAKDEK